jgi:RimJ/RimL family protein N-acetyltransferase
LFLNGVLGLYAGGQVAPWGVFHKDDRKIIGTCGFVYWLPHHARAEIAYAIGRPYWNRGLMTEAVRMANSFGFRVMRLNRLEARAEAPNVGSTRVMEKAGMTFEGVLRQHMYAKGRYRDLKLYAVLAQDWRDDPERLRTVPIGGARVEDAEAIHGVARESWEATYRDIYTPEFISEFVDRNYSVEGLERSIAGGRSTYLVARDFGRVVGFCHFGIGPRGPELYRMYLRPDYWRSGIGRRFVHMMEAGWRAQGVAAYFCYVHERNEVGKGFYLKARFVHDPSRDDADEWCLVRQVPS